MKKKERIIQICNGEFNPICLTSYGRAIGVVCSTVKDRMGSPNYIYSWADITPQIEEIK